MNWVYLALLMVGLALLYAASQWIRRMKRSDPPDHPKAFESLGAASQLEGRSIPKIIWTFWNPLPAPDLVERCWANWRKFVPDHELRILDRQSMMDWLPQSTMPKDFDQWTPPRQSDWLRLNLLATHGGIWSDASNFFTCNFDWLHQAQQQGDWEFAGYYLDQFTKDHSRPIVESWFLAAVPGSQLLKDWCAEFEAAMAQTPKAYLNGLKQSGEYKAVVQAIPWPDYLLIHVCLSRLLQRDVKRYRFGVWRAEDSAYAFHSRVNWSRRNLFVRLCLLPAGERVAPMIKLRGGDRRRFSYYITDKNWVRQGSVVDLYLPPPAVDWPKSTLPT